MKQFETREDCLNYIDTLSFAQLRNLLADCLMERQIDKPVVSIEQLARCFKIRGYAVKDGELVPDGRGKFSVGRGGRKEEL